MKRFFHIILVIAAASFIVSCAKMDMDYYGAEDIESSVGDVQYAAIVTVKKTPTDTVYFQLNDSITVYPYNYQDSYTRMQRVICEVSASQRATGSFNYTAGVLWLEALDEGSVTSNASVVGSDGLDIVDDWMTGVEDGYLTLHYNTKWGKNPVQHSFYLLTGVNPSDPYEVELRHNANGDKKEEDGDSLICFDINSLPDTEGQYKELTLKWTTSGGTASEKKFKFKTRK